MGAMSSAEFTALEAHGFLDLERCVVTRTSAGLGWSKAFMSVQEQLPFKKRLQPRPDVLLAVINSGLVRGKVGARNRVYNLEDVKGNIAIVPDNVGLDVELQSKIWSTHLYIRRAVFDEVAETIYRVDPASIEIAFRPALYDAVLEQLCHAIRETLDNGSRTSALYVEHMTHAVAAHLLRHHSNVGLQSEASQTNGKLSARQLERTRELIEAKLGERITLADIAADTGLGADHFSRVFKQETGLSPYQFVIRRRVDRARHLLAETVVSIAGIAHECGFADQVHLTRAFRRIVGTTPAAYRREKQT